MYNRYIPDSDGSYRKDSRPDIPPAPYGRIGKPIGSFLKNLLPKNTDTGDLIILLMLLLIAGDDSESRSNAILTMAFYFFL